MTCNDRRCYRRANRELLFDRGFDSEGDQTDHARQFATERESKIEWFRLLCSSGRPSQGVRNRAKNSRSAHGPSWWRSDAGQAGPNAIRASCAPPGRRFRDQASSIAGQAWPNSAACFNLASAMRANFCQAADCCLRRPAGG